LAEHLNVRVLEVEVVRVTPETRSRFPFLRHVPMGCDAVNVLEIDLRPLVPKSVLAKFKDDIQRRKQRRKRQLQIRASQRQDDQAQLVSHAMHVDDLLELQAVLRAEEESRLSDLFNGPAIGFGSGSGAGTGAASRASDGADPSSGVGAGAGVGVARPLDMRDNLGNKAQVSFAKIAEGGGYYPSLGETHKTVSLSGGGGSAASSAAKVLASGLATGATGAWSKPTSVAAAEPISPSLSAKAELWPRGAAVPLRAPGSGVSTTNASALASSGSKSKFNDRKGQTLFTFG
jgi:hypothetical protein